MQYPEEWNQLPKRERKKKLRDLKRQNEQKSFFSKKIRNAALVLILIAVIAFGFIAARRKTPEQVEFTKQVESASLDGKVEVFEIEGDDHVNPRSAVNYKTNPPTSGDHYSQEADWGVYDKELIDEQVVHSLEHGGIWISYKDIESEEKATLEDLGRNNSQSVIVSPRSANDNKIVIASWGQMMKLDQADMALIQKYIDTYKNNSPEKFAR